MQTTPVMTSTTSTSKGALWTGRVLTTLVVLFLLFCTILYIIPRTAILGAILLTGYLGGATAVSVMTGYPFFFPVIFGILAWLGLWLRDAGLRRIVPLRMA